ncbi:MAG: hypothetical protein CME55_04500 [Halieaceae bacterium]|nr:hypothetical protein [Halieaceae bacterium]|tara:strand:- start:2504 stop:2734 length:231 start_codon:yes stop_codon:yes gene_type:complete
MSNEKAMAIIDDCRARLQEAGVEDVMIAMGGEGGVAFSFSGATKTLAYLSMSAWLEVMMSSMASQHVESGPLTDDV